MKRVVIILLTATIYSCNSHMNKPIFEPLTVDELRKSINNDSLFEETYKSILFIRDSILKSDVEKAKYADLTYRRVHKLSIFSQDTNHFNPIRAQLKKEWREKYGILLKKVDSISKYWKNYRDENSLAKYVKIELAEINKEYYSYSYGIKNIYLGFKLTPLKGQVDQLRFSYEIEAKINEKENPYESIYSSLNKSWCLTTTPFTNSTIRYWEANYTNEKSLENKTIETFFRDYNIYVEIDQMRKDGRNIRVEDLIIPKCIKNHWKYENDEYLKDLYVADILKDILNIEYIHEYEYIHDGITKILKLKDGLALDFLSLTKE